MNECLCESLYAKLPEEAFCRRMGGVWVAKIPGGQGIHVFGNTHVEALEKLIALVNAKKREA